MQTCQTRTKPVAPMRRLVSKALFLASLLALINSGCMAQGGGVKSAAAGVATTSAQEHGARAAMEKLIQAYESGEAIGMDSYLDPAMLGAPALLDHIRETQGRQKQIRVHFKDMQTLVSADTVIFTAKWEKRYLAMPDLTPRLATGQASFMLRSRASGWRLSAITGDNIFAAYAN